MRVLKPGGVMSFLVIVDDDSATDSLDGDAETIGSGDDYVDLLAKAGFQNIEVVDVTDEYAATVEAWIREWGVESDDIVLLNGLELFAERLSRWNEGLQKVHAGVRTRYALTGRRL